MAAYADYVNEVRVEVDDVAARAFTTADLYLWISEAARQISLAGRNLRGEWSVAFAAGTATGNVSSNLVIEIDDAWWKFDASEMRYPLQIVNHRDMHSRWGMYRDIRQGIPTYLTGVKTSTSGALAVAAQTMELRLYPIPQAAGVLYYQGSRAASIPTIGASPSTPATDQVECEVGWEYLIVKYAASKALARGRDPQRAAQLMEEYMDGLRLLASFADSMHLPGSREFVPQYFGNAWQGYGYGGDYGDWGY